MGSAMQALMILIKYFIPVVILVLWVLMAISITNRIVKFIRIKKWNKLEKEIENEEKSNN